MSYETGTDSFLLDESVKVSATGVPDWEDMTLRQERHLNSLLARRNAIVLSLLFITGFLIKVLPIMQYDHVGGDPFLHYKYAMALLDGKLAVPVEFNAGSTTVELYYPPLFHLISLGFFLAFPNLDPYAIMKVLAATFAVLQIVPIFYIVKRVAHWSPAALLASYSLLTVRSDYQMLSWGGYANIMGLFLISALVYLVMSDKLILSAVVSATLALTHHLSFLLMIVVLIPYFAMSLLKRKAIPRALIGSIIGGAVAYLLFYRFALVSILQFYPQYSPVYDQSLYVTPYILEQVGPLLLLFGTLGFILSFVHDGRRLAEHKDILVIWAIVPLLLAFAYLFGVQWHGVRWIHFIPQPFIVWAGIALSYLREKKFLIVLFIFLFGIQLIGTIQGYYNDILEYVQ